MALKARIDSVATDINLIVNDLLSPAAQSRAIADFARDAIGEANKKNQSILGRIPPNVTTVDGQRNGQLENVRPNGGVIVTEWELVNDVLIWIGEALLLRSPVISGDYKKAHTLFADGKEVPLGMDVPPADEYVFLNPLPYARKLEIGKTKSGRDFAIQAPNRIYERTADDAKKKFGNIANIRFSYRGTESSAILSYVPLGRVWARNAKTGRYMKAESTGDTAAAAHERSLRVPAIVVTLRAS